MFKLPPFLLFDMDDTILEFTAVGEACWEKLCSYYAPRFGNISPEELLIAIRKSNHRFWNDPETAKMYRVDLPRARRMIIRSVVEAINSQAFQLGDELADAFTKQREEMLRPFPGAIETLEELSRRGIRMAMVTNGSAIFQRSKIVRFQLERFFEAIFIESEFGIGKPEKQVFLSALERLGAAPEQTWMIGDGLIIDILPAQELGMQTVWVDHQKTGLPANSPVSPTWIVNNISELLA